MNFFGFGSGCPDIEIKLDGRESRKLAEIKTEDGKRERHPLYYDGETVSGEVQITMRKAGSKFEHQGVRIELIGQVDLYYDRGTPHFFLSLYKDLARPGELLQTQSFRFEFIKAEKPYESYSGANCRLRYFLRVSIMKRLTDIVKEMDLVVHTLCAYPDLNSSIKMEVGIEDCLHIEFEYNRSKYHLKDVIVGKIYFLLVRIKVKQMELAIIKRETAGTGPNTLNENETIAKYEIMDGAPTKGESVPIRVFLAGYDLTPTFRDVNRKFSVRYYLNLVLVDEEDRRYFKQQEIILWRKVDKPRKSFQASLQQQLRQMKNPSAQGIKQEETLPGTSATENKNTLEPTVQSRGSTLDRKLSKDNRRTSEELTDRSTPHESRPQLDPTPNDAGRPSSLLFVAGTRKTLSGDDSDEEPLLTGAICQADVHQRSEPGVDVAATIEDIEDFDEVLRINCDNEKEE